MQGDGFLASPDLEVDQPLGVGLAELSEEARCLRRGEAAVPVTSPEAGTLRCALALYLPVSGVTSIP